MSAKGKVVLHIGLPKTGTTALQSWCAGMRSDLARAGIVYPDTVPSDPVPKHQYIIDELRTSTNTRLRAILRAGEGRTIALSTEGLANQFWDVSEGQLAQFRSVLTGFEVKVFVVTREREAWLKSYYKQCVINPPVPGYPYATKLALPDFSQVERVRFLHGLPHQTRLLSAAFGAEEVMCANYEGSWFADWCELVGWPEPDAQLPTKNESVSDQTIDFVIAVNRLELQASSRSILLGSLHRAINSRHTMLRIYADSIGPDPGDLRQCHLALETLCSEGGHVAEMAHRLRSQLEVLDGNRDRGP